MEADQIQEIHRLRGLNLSPKEIARSLKLRPAEVSAILREQATALEQTRAAKGEIDPLYNCLVNESGAALLKRGFFTKKSEGNGFAQVFVARSYKMKLSVCSYLVDYWCLGVKDALGPKTMSNAEYAAMVQSTSLRFQEDIIEITLEQAQAIIFGGVEYAAKLGIDPHRDFAPAKAHLGVLPDKLPSIKFGKNGKPFYASGPYDNPQRIIAKLNESVGEGNYDYIIGLQ